MTDVVRAFGPGRVNLIGEHTDYNGGRSLPFALALGATVEARGRDDGQVVVVARDLGETDAFELRSPAPVDGWRAFVRGTAGELQAAGHVLIGADLEVSSTVPIGSGLSSSAALEVGLALALLGLAGVREPDRRALAALCSRVETDWVGAQTGLLDQTASLLCRAGHALRIDFRSGATEDVPLVLDGWRLALLDSGQAHTNRAATGYNTRRAECVEACRLLDVPTLSDADEAELQRLPETLRRRARHVLTENIRVDATVTALRRGDWPEVGRLLDAAHASFRDDFEASTPAVEATVQRLHDLGAAGARLVGGGFGGHVLGLFAPDVPPPAEALVVEPGPGAAAVVLT